MSLAFLQQWHQYLITACKNPCPDEDVHDLRRQRRRVAELIACWKETSQCGT